MERYGCRKCGTPLPAVRAGETLRVRCAERSCGCVNVIPADPSLAPWESHGSTRLLVVDDPNGAVLLAPPIERKQPYKLLITLSILLMLLGTLAVPSIHRGILLRCAVYELQTTRNAATARLWCQLLKNMGPPAKSAAPIVWKLQQTTFNGGYKLKEDFINDVLDAVDPAFVASKHPAVTRNSSTAELIAALRFPDVRVRRSAARLLGDGGTASRDAVGPLAAMADRTQDDARIDAIEALGRIGTEASRAVPTLIRLLTASGTIRIAAVNALNEIAPHDPHVLDAIDHSGIPAPTSQSSR